jgi:GntR family transcriptional regulator
LYQKHYGQTIVRTSERLRVALVSKQHAEWLNLSSTSPVLVIRRVALGIQDEPLEWRVSILNTNSHEYFSELVV